MSHVLAMARRTASTASCFPPLRASSAVDKDLEDESASLQDASNISDSDIESDHSDYPQSFLDVDLGFVRRVRNPLLLDSGQFPSKLGGLPAWLDYKNIPRATALTCGACDHRMSFVLQIYAPLDEEVLGHNSAFHRSLYLFCCRKKNCAGGQAKCRIIRGQLPRTNSFYSYNPPENVEAEVTFLSPTENLDYRNAQMCPVCGLNATYRCGKCRKIRYCSKECQKVDWNMGHRQLCNSEVPEEDGMVVEARVSDARKEYRFPEYEIWTEPHPSPEISDNESSDSFVKQGGTLQHIDQSEMLESMFKSKKDTVDREFLKFQEKVRPAPSQVLRYERGASPLWLSKTNRCRDPGKCTACSRPLIFEFQVMPQVLYYMKVHQGRMKGKQAKISSVTEELCSDFDWGTLVIYTCPASCRITRTVGLGAYSEEYVWLQPSQ